MLLLSAFMQSFAGVFVVKDLNMTNNIIVLKKRLVNKMNEDQTGVF